MAAVAAWFGGSDFSYVEFVTLVVVSFGLVVVWYGFCFW
jgi:hypothetical protein